MSQGRRRNGSLAVTHPVEVTPGESQRRPTDDGRSSSTAGGRVPRVWKYGSTFRKIGLRGETSRRVTGHGSFPFTGEVPACWGLRTSAGPGTQDPGHEDPENGWGTLRHQWPVSGGDPWHREGPVRPITPDLPRHRLSAQADGRTSARTGFYRLKIFIESVENKPKTKFSEKKKKDVSWYIVAFPVVTVDSTRPAPPPSRQGFGPQTRARPSTAPAGHTGTLGAGPVSVYPQEVAPEGKDTGRHVGGPGAPVDRSRGQTVCLPTLPPVCPPVLEGHVGSPPLPLHRHRGSRTTSHRSSVINTFTRVDPFYTDRTTSPPSSCLARLLSRRR